jgi:hypothetical protein
LIIAGDGYAYLPYVYQVSTSVGGTVPAPGTGLCSFTGTSSTEEHLRLLRVGTQGDAYVIVLGDWNSNSYSAPGGSSSQSAPVPNPDGLIATTPITNADTGVLISWKEDTAAYCASQSSDGESGCVDEMTIFKLATTEGTAMANTTTFSVPQQQEPIQPEIQRADGSYVGSSDSNMYAFTTSGQLLWTVPNDSSRFALADGSVVGVSGTTYDTNGNANGQIATAVPSWIGAEYGLSTAGFSSFSFSSPGLAGTFAAILGGNHSNNITAIQQVLTNQPQGPNDQVPPSGVTLHPTYHSIELLTSTSLDGIFKKYIQTFQGGKGTNNDVMDTKVNTPTGTVTGINQTLTFTLHGIASLGQGPFSVRISRFDPASYTMVAVTQQGHPLDGWRYWRVFSVGTNDIVIETGAADRPHPGPLNYVGYYLVNGQLKVWQEFLQFIQRDLKAPQGTNPQDNIVKGTRTFDLNYILQNICLSCP